MPIFYFPFLSLSEDKKTTRNVTLSNSPVIVLESIFVALVTKPCRGRLLSAIERAVVAGRPIELEPVTVLVASLPDPTVAHYDCLFFFFDDQFQ